MKYLLDTHTALWWINENENLSFTAKAMLLDNKHELFVSMVSAWEVAIKTSLGKLYEFKGGVKAFMQKLNNLPVTILPVSSHHIEAVEILPFLHRDPFDRFLVAIAKTENMTILTAEKDIPKYDVLSAW